MNNPMELINLLKGNITPKQLCLNMIGVNSNPMIKNLVEMAEKGQTEELMNFGRNLYSQKGMDFDKEMKELQSYFDK